MGIGEDFKTLLNNVAINNSEVISLRYGEVTASLNKSFRDTESKFANSLQVGSYGRWTAIRGISDLDMIYIMPKSSWDTYKNGGQYKLLSDVAKAIRARYPTTTVKVDRLVVRVLYNNFDIEVQPAFEQSDFSYVYPDTKDNGSWKTTKPRDEINEIQRKNNESNRNLRRLCKLVRAWKNKHGVAMGGLLIDTLAHRYLCSTTFYDDKSYFYYRYMVRDFFEYLSNEPDKEYYMALGSGQRVAVKKRFQRKAKRAYELCVKAIDASGQKGEYQKWRNVFGNVFPAPLVLEKAAYDSVFEDTEEFVEDRFLVDIRYDVKIECDVTQRGFRRGRLTDFLRQNIPLFRRKSLDFYIKYRGINESFELYWKVLNRGEIARRKNCIRGQIFSDSGWHKINETTDFAGDHLVECYVVQRGVVVARNKILVPIDGREDEYV